MPFEHFGPDRPWGVAFGWLLPFLLTLAIAGVAIWAVVRITRHPPAATALPVAPAPIPAVPSAVGTSADPALERVRMRYAAGEIAREEYLRLRTDLGARAAQEAPQEENADG